MSSAHERLGILPLRSQVGRSDELRRGHRALKCAGNKRDHADSSRRETTDDTPDGDSRVVLMEHGSMTPGRCRFGRSSATLSV